MATANSNKRRLFALLLAAVLVWLAIGGVFAAGDESAPPTNDLCASATVVSGDAATYTNMIDVSQATVSADDPVTACGAAAGNSNSVWYRITPSRDFEAVLSTSGSGYDTVMAVFDGSCGQFVELTCDDDSGIGATSYIDAFTFHAGRTYFVEIMEYGPNGGIGFDAGDKGPNTPASGMLHFTLNARQALAVKLADLTTTAPILSLALLVAVALGLLLLTFVAVKRQEMRDRLRKIRATRRRRQFDD